VVVNMMPGQTVDDAGQFAITGFRHTALEKDQLHDDAFRGVGARGYSVSEKSPGMPFSRNSRSHRVIAE
jgi:hypothetical protein